MFLKDKVCNIINQSLNKWIGGEKFFDELDREFRKSENLDIIKSILYKIIQNNGNFCNIVVTGKFGEWIKIQLIDKKIVPFNGTLLLVSGSITSHQGFLHKIQKDKKIEIIYKSGDIENKEFIFFDDSYYSGTTFTSISNFLSLKNSTIKKSYVIYDGSDKVLPSRWSAYNYYKHHSGTRLPLNKLLSYLHSISVSSPIESIETKILKGEMKTYREIYNEVEKLSKKFGTNILDKDKYLVPHRLESIKIKKYKEWIKS